MQSNLYAIQDILVGFHQPMIAPNDEAVKRDFKIWCNKKTIEEAADMRLFKIGIYDDQTGIITPINPEYMLDGLTERSENNGNQ